jgi:hypothetical protein
VFLFDGLGFFFLICVDQHDQVKWRSKAMYLTSNDNRSKSGKVQEGTTLNKCGFQWGESLTEQRRNAQKRCYTGENRTLISRLIDAVEQI